MALRSEARRAGLNSGHEDEEGQLVVSSASRENPPTGAGEATQICNCQMLLHHQQYVDK